MTPVIFAIGVAMFHVGIAVRLLKTAPHPPRNERRRSIIDYTGPIYNRHGRVISK